jgi:pimeloyl-ACP methyl ester carboxylesterase
MKHPGKTPPFRGPQGEPVPGSIAEINYLRLGGTDQWVMIRGESIANPPLILLHGGPGMSETSFFRHCNAPLEESFTVVYWDQRGAGKSFERRIPTSSMTVEQFVADLDELVTYTCTRLGTNKVTIFGHSWGSALGMLYATVPGEGRRVRRQRAVWRLVSGRSRLVRVRTRRGATSQQQQGPEGATRDGSAAVQRKPAAEERTWIQRFDGQLSPRGLWSMSRLVPAGPESSIIDLPNLLRGSRFSQNALWAEASTLNLLKLAPALQMPVFFFLGRRDHWVPPETSAAYFEALVAPSKKLVWLEESGHEPFVDEPSKFNAAMIELCGQSSLALHWRINRRTISRKAGHSRRSDCMTRNHGQGCRGRAGRFRVRSPPRCHGPNIDSS